MEALVTILKVFFLMFFTQSLFISSIFFSSGHIFPTYLEGFYAKTTDITRLIIVMFTSFALGNYIIVKMYSNFDPSLVTLMNIFCVVCSSIILTILVFNFKPSFMIVPATMLVALGAVWVSYLLQQK